MRSLIALFMFLLLSFHAHAASEKEQIINELFEIIDLEANTAGSAAETFSLGVKQILEVRGKSITEEKLAVIREAFLKEFLPRIPEITEHAKTVYLETYTKEELKKALEFYKTPEGISFYKKSMKVMQTLALYGGRVGMEAGKAAGIKLQKSAALK